MKRLTLKAASERTGVSKSKIWRSVNDGELIAEKGRTSGGQEAWLVREDDLDRWSENHLNQSEIVESHSAKESETAEEPEVVQEFQTEPEHFSEPFQGHSEPFTVIQEPPVELYLALVDKMTRSERRSVELEIELKKYRLLLTENAESIIEREALIKETEAKFQEAEAVLKKREEDEAQARAEAEEAKQKLKAAQDEIEKAKLEAKETAEQLKEARTQMATWEEQRKAPFWKRWFKTG